MLQRLPHASAAASLCLGALLALSPATGAQFPKELDYPRKEPRTELERRYPLPPIWRAYDLEKDAWEYPDPKKPDRWIGRRAEDGCFLNNWARWSHPTPYPTESVEEHLARAKGVAFVRVRSVTPGFRGRTMASALEVVLIEKVKDPLTEKGAAGPFPRYLLYPGATVPLIDGGTFCMRDLGFPPVPEPGDELAVSFSVWTGELTGLDFVETLILNLDADGPKAFERVWKQTPEAVRAYPRRKLKAWLRTAAHKEVEGRPEPRWRDSYVPRR